MTSLLGMRPEPLEPDPSELLEDESLELLAPLDDGELLLGPLEDEPLPLGPLDDAEPLLDEVADDDGPEEEPLLPLPLLEADELGAVDELGAWLLLGSTTLLLASTTLDDGSDEDGSDEEGAELEGALEDPLDDHDELEDQELLELQEEDPLDDPLEEPLEELEQLSQQQQPAWWLKAHGPSYRVSVEPDRQIETARV